MPDPIVEAGMMTAALEAAARAGRAHLEGLESAPVAVSSAVESLAQLEGPLPGEGMGTMEALALLIRCGLPAATGSAGPRFFHFVTGGVTPAALAADWLASAIDQNAFNWVSSPLATRLEQVAQAWLKELFGLPAEWGGVLTTGATMANFTGLAAARRWWAAQHGVDVDEIGLAGLPVMPILAGGYVHASALKALAMLGLGRAAARILERDPRGELDLDALAAALEGLRGAPALVLATAGDVNTGAFDPIGEMADLASRHNAWLHVDGAFGLFARVTPRASALADGLEAAGSVASDGHKWLNVPYDCGFAFVRDPRLLEGAFGLSAAYLRQPDPSRPSFGSLGPESSRRARSLAVWATLAAYGQTGYRDMVERHLELARRVGEEVEDAADMELLAPVRLNVVCFRYKPHGWADHRLDALNLAIGDAVLADGRVFLGTTRYGGRSAFRPAITNWRTREEDVDLIVPVIREIGERLASP